MSHVASRRSYLGIFFLLLLLTAATVGAAFLDLGPLNNVMALGIAFTKAVLVILFFMHVRASEKLVWVYLVAAVYWLAILIGITLADFGSRVWLHASPLLPT